MRKNNRPYEKILSALHSCQQDERRSRWNSVSFKDISPLFKEWDSLSKRQKIKAVKDSRWNHYPMDSWTPTSRKRFGPAIGRLVKSVVLKGEDDLKILERHSSGVFALFVMDNSSAKVRLNMAKRLRNSSDYRIRTRVVRILPTHILKKYAKDFLSDSHYTVRTLTMNRLGIDNCYKIFIPEVSEDGKRLIFGNSGSKVDGNNYYWGRWLVYQALDMASLEEVSHLIPFLDQAERLDCQSLDHRMVSSIFKKIPKEDLLYHLNNSSLQKSLFEAKFR